MELVDRGTDCLPRIAAVKDETGPRIIRVFHLSPFIEPVSIIQPQVLEVLRRNSMTVKQGCDEYVL